NFTGNPPAQPSVNPAPQPPARHNLGDTLREDLSKVHLPQIQVPQIHAPNIHVPPQFIHTPAPIRKYQPPFILVGAVVIGLALVAVLWLAVDNFIPGKPISNFFGRTIGGTSANASRTAVPRQTQVTGGQNVDNLLRVGDELASQSKFEPAIAQYQAAAKYSPNEADVYTHWARALALTGRIGEAITVAQKATRLDPTSSKAFTELTRALSWAG